MGLTGAAVANAEDLYLRWKSSHLLSHIAIFSLFTIVAQGVCIVFDPLFFGGLEGISLYTPWRLIHIAFVLLVFWTARAQKPSYESLSSSSSSNEVLSFRNQWLLIAPELSFFGLYHYFLTIASEAHRPIVLIGNILVIFFTGFILHRYWKEFFILILLSLPSTLWFQNTHPELYTSFLLIQITMVISVIACYFMQRIFTNSLVKELKLVSVAVPPREAALIVTSESEEEWSHVFRLRKRYCACIVADWRGYQDLISSRGAEAVEYCFTVFYGTILKVLNETIQNGTFFVDWTADEVFIIIYDESDHQDVVNLQAARVCRALADSVFRTGIPLLGLPIVYDIGATVGEGMLGLQGPPGMKRTTVTSAHAGLAKRLESSAKKFRKPDSLKDAEPILIMDQTLAQTGLKAEIFKEKDLKVVHIESKDVDIDHEYVLFTTQSDQLESDSLQRLSAVKRKDRT